MVWLTLRLGRPVGQALLYPITAWFFLCLHAERSASRAYLRRVLEREPGAGDVWRHFFTFACVVLDRISFLADRTERFRIRIDGHAQMQANLAEGRGCLLLGAHFGSFEVLRAFGRESPVPVKALMYRGTTGALSTVMEALDPAIRREVIEIGAADSMLRVRESLARGEIVGILADRAPDLGGRRRARVPFLGTPASFPTGPLALAAALQVPVLLFFGIRRGPRDYQVVIEPFARRAAMPPDADAARFAGRLAAQCRAYPFNWFNFYDFWEEQTGDAAPTESSARASACVPGPARRARHRAAAAGPDR